MKVSLTQVTLPTVSSVNVTDPAITSDWQGAIIFGGTPSVNNTTTANTGFYIGAVDAGGRNLCLAGTAQDNTAGAVAAGIMSNTACALFFTSSAGINASAAYSATLSNGFTIATTGGAFAKLANVLMFAGSDVQFAVASSHLAAAQASATITHNLSVAPDIVIVLATMAPGSLGTGSQTNGFSVGFYDNTQTNSIGYGSAIVSGANPTNVAARCGSVTVGEQFNASLVNSGNWAISAVGSTSLTLTRGDTGTAGNVGIICIGHNTGRTVAASAYADTTPTVTGNHTPITGMAVAPQLWLSMNTRLTSTAATNNDTAGSWGFGAAVNNAGSTQQMASASSFQYNLATSVGKSYIINTEPCVTLTSAGVVNFVSVIATWNSNGFTENVASASGVAQERINLVYGSQSAVSAATSNYFTAVLP